MGASLLFSSKTCFVNAAPALGLITCLVSPVTRALLMELVLRSGFALSVWPSLSRLIETLPRLRPVWNSIRLHRVASPRTHLPWKHRSQNSQMLYRHRLYPRLLPRPPPMKNRRVLLFAE